MKKAVGITVLVLFVLSTFAIGLEVVKVTGSESNLTKVARGFNPRIMTRDFSSGYKLRSPATSRGACMRLAPIDKRAWKLSSVEKEKAKMKAMISANIY